MRGRSFLRTFNHKRTSSALIRKNAPAQFAAQYWATNRSSDAPAMGMVCVRRAAGFEFNGPHEGPLFYRHLRAPSDRIGRHRRAWTGKHNGKHYQHCWLRAKRPQLHRSLRRSVMATPNPVEALEYSIVVCV
jgi:hypothetical protein